jgi:hypothetical protein
VAQEYPRGLAEEIQGMNLSRWHTVAILVVVLLLVAALIVGEERSISAVGNQVGTGQRGASLDAVRNIVTIIGVIIAAGSLAFTAINTDLTWRTSRARFWLDLRDQFAKHADVHNRLRPAGDWAGDKGGPATPKEWAQVEAYMGLFEHCEIMLYQKLIYESTFEEIYSYRLSNVVANTIIRREKLCERASGWKRFLELTQRMGIKINC